jgi:hypothetical protein
MSKPQENGPAECENEFGAELGRIDLAEKDLVQLVTEVRALIEKYLTLGMSKAELLAGYKQGKAIQVANAENGYKNRTARSTRLAFEKALKQVPTKRKRSK